MPGIVFLETDTEGSLLQLSLAIIIAAYSFPERNSSESSDIRTVVATDTSLLTVETRVITMES